MSQATMGIELVRVPQADIARFEDVANQCSLQALGAKGQLTRTLMMARGIQLLRELVTEDMMRDVMALQGTKLGFRTDRDKDGGYPLLVVKECFIEATLRGLRSVGNEWNIIAANCYVTKEGLTRLVGEFPDLTDLVIVPDLTAMKEGKAMVNCKATWKINAHALELERNIPIRVNQGSIVDAVLGKARRKMLASIYEQITGSQMSIPEGDATDLEALPAPPRDRLAKELEAPDEPSMEDQIRKEETRLQEAINSSTIIGEVREIAASLDSNAFVSDKGRQALLAQAAAREKEIRENRGPRSNKAKAGPTGELFDNTPSHTEAGG